MPLAASAVLLAPCVCVVADLDAGWEPDDLGHGPLVAAVDVGDGLW